MFEEVLEFRACGENSYKSLRSRKIVIYSAYDFCFHVVDSGQKVPVYLSQFSGKVILIVNTASKCVLSRQYGDLLQLHDSYFLKGLVIINVPSNSFAGQEPRSDEDISTSCVMNSRESIITVAREDVTGDSAHPFYRWAREVLDFGASPWWNFHKYLVNRNGGLVDYFCPLTRVNSPRVLEVIERLLLEGEH